MRSNDNEFNSQTPQMRQSHPIHNQRCEMQQSSLSHSPARHASAFLLFVCMSSQLQLQKVTTAMRKSLHPIFHASIRNYLSELRNQFGIISLLHFGRWIRAGMGFRRHNILPFYQLCNCNLSSAPKFAFKLDICILTANLNNACINATMMCVCVCRVTANGI